MQPPRRLLSSRTGPAVLLVASLLLAASVSVDSAQRGGAPAFVAPPLYPDATPVCPCESLSRVRLRNTTIDSAATDPTDGSCRVTAIVTHPPARDRVRVFVGLPMKGWNGRFWGTGGGGFSGGSPRSLSAPVSQGYAAGATDTGHEGGSGSFALDANGRLDWQAIRNNAYLGIHEMTVVGKALTRALYGKDARYAYFVGGSTGGRQGLSEVQRFPGDYNGVIAIAPAINWAKFVPSEFWPQVVMLEARHFVPIPRLRAATAAAVAACDGMDGVRDGVIDDPSRCHYDPGELVGATVGDSPLTAADAEVVRKIWEGPRGPEGEFLWHGLTRGTELHFLAKTEGSPLAGKPFQVTLDWFRYFLKKDAGWDWTTITAEEFAQLFQQSVEEFGPVIGTDNPDLAPFRDRGGKVILLHGLIDQLIPPQGTVDYYQRVQQQMGGAGKTARFARLFLAPGVGHGFGDTGPAPVRTTEAIVRWVEEGRAPGVLHAELRDASGKVIRSRPLFPYPRVAKYRGRGSTDEEASFVSRIPETVRRKETHADVETGGRL